MDEETAKRMLRESLNNLHAALSSETVAESNRINALLSVSNFADLVVSLLGAGPPVIPFPKSLATPPGAATQAVVSCPSCGYKMNGVFQ